MINLTEIKKRKYQFIFREFGGVPLLIDAVISKVFFSDEEKIIIYEKPQCEGYISEKGLETARKRGEKFYLDAVKVRQFLVKAEEIGDSSKKLFEDIEKVDLNKINNKQLFALFEQLLKQFTLLMKYYNTTEPRRAGSCEQKIRNFLLPELKDEKKVDNALSVLLTPDTSKTIFNQESLTRLKLVQKIQKDHKNKNFFQKNTNYINQHLREFNHSLYKKILRHQKNFGSLSNVTGTTFWDVRYFLDLIKKNVRQPEKKIQKEIDGITNREKQIKKDRLQLENQLKLPLQMANLVESLRETGLLRLNLDPYWRYGVALFFGKFLPEISRRIYFTADQTASLLYSELKDILINKKEPPLDLVNQREKQYFAIHENEGFCFLNGKRAEKHIAFMKSLHHAHSTQDQDLISGTVVQSGFKKGKVRIIHSSKGDAVKEMQKMKKGEILVTEMTRPQFIAAIKKAGAIVTDEGGLTSHAAIISREFKIPCIVGTKIATQVLQNGDLIEVDATKGTVKKI